MVRIKEHKHQTENKVIERLPLPLRVYIPLSQHLGKACKELVKVGDSVCLGQKIATSDSHVFSPIHASISGKVNSIVDWPHPVLGRCKSIVIDGDGIDTVQSSKFKVQSEIQNLSAEEIRKKVFEAGIVGMGGASFPTHIKLNPPKKVHTLIINGAECEPYLTGDYRLMVEKAREIVKGIELIVRCLGVESIFIAIEDNKPQAIKVFKEAVCNTTYVVRILKSQYPQGGEKQLIKSLMNIEVPSGKLPFDVGIVVHNVATVYAIYEAVYLDKPLYERVVTVTGDCIANPRNLLVRIGTPVKELIDFCAPLKQEPTKVIFGGPMMGIAQFSLETPIIKSTNGIICLSKEEAETRDEGFCLRCGRCVEYCPMGLMPCMISMASEKEKWDLAKAYRCLDCMECGLCSYVCPQSRNIVQAVKQAKLKVNR